MEIVPEGRSTPSQSLAHGRRGFWQWRAGLDAAETAAEKKLKRWKLRDAEIRTEDSTPWTSRRDSTIPCCGIAIPQSGISGILLRSSDPPFRLRDLSPRHRNPELQSGDLRLQLPDLGLHLSGRKTGSRALRLQWSAAQVNCSSNQANLPHSTAKSPPPTSPSQFRTPHSAFRTFLRLPPSDLQNFGFSAFRFSAFQNSSALPITRNRYPITTAQQRRSLQENRDARIQVFGE